MKASLVACQSMVSKTIDCCYLLITNKRKGFFYLPSLECTSYLLVLFKLLADDISHDPYFLHKSRFSFSFLFLSFPLAWGPTWRSLSRGAHVDKDTSLPFCCMLCMQPYIESHGLARKTMDNGQR